MSAHGPRHRRGAVLLAAMLASAGLVTCPAADAAEWSTPLALSSSGDPQLQSAVTSARGDALVNWMQHVDPDYSIVDGVRRAPGGRFGAVQTLSDPGERVIFASSGMDARGDTGVLWWEGGGAFGVEGRLFDGGGT